MLWFGMGAYVKPVDSCLEKDAAQDELLNNHPSGNIVELHDDEEYYEEEFQERCEERVPWRRRMI